MMIDLKKNLEKNGDLTVTHKNDTNNHLSGRAVVVAVLSGFGFDVRGG